MFSTLVALHIMVCLSLIFIVLLQHGRGAEMGSGFGAGSNQTIFGSTGASSFLSKVTTGVAVAFMLTSLTLAFISVRRGSSSSLVGDVKPAATAPAVPSAPPATN